MQSTFIHVQRISAFVFVRNTRIKNVLQVMYGFGKIPLMIIYHFCYLSNSLSLLLRQCSYVFLNRRSEIFFLLFFLSELSFELSSRNAYCNSLNVEKHNCVYRGHFFHGDFTNFDSSTKIRKVTVC